MWTTENRRRYDRDELRYPSDLTDDEWARVEDLIPPKRWGRRREFFADAGYQGPQFRKELARMLAAVVVEIVKRLETAKGFEVLPRRWVVERTLAWLNRCPQAGQGFRKPEP
jgi:transposase